VLVDTSALTGARRATSAATWIRPAAAGGEVTADCGIVGDLGRWHRRLAAALPGTTLTGLELSGAIEATAAVTPAPAAGGDAWRITKAGGEIERFAMRLGDRQVTEPRIVATAAGLVRPATGAVEISSAEVLSSSLSIRSGGATWVPAIGAVAGPLDALLASVRGRVQGQADLARLADWLVPRGVAAAWPLSGRAWGTLDVAETQLVVNLLAEATGSEVAIARRPAQGEPRGVWAEPQAKIVLELTRPYARVAGGGLTTADRLVVDRLSLESSTVAVAARGTVEEWSGRRLAELSGSVTIRRSARPSPSRTVTSSPMAVTAR
jgi:hypothetical protein